MLQKEQILLIVYFTIVILFLSSFAIVFFITFQKRKNKLLLDKLKAEKRFEDELQTSKIEIQEQTLKNVSWELHDNIGQLLSTAVMQINIISSGLDAKTLEGVQDVRKLVGDSLQEIRNLSKTLNHEVIENIGLERSIQVELNRFEKLNFLKTTLEVSANEVAIDPKDEIILYRIIQEFFSNTIKHAEAEHLDVKLLYNEDYLNISITDDGVGYDMDNVQANSGLLNMKSRASLINAELTAHSELEKGTKLIIKYPLEKDVRKELD